MPLRLAHDELHRRCRGYDAAQDVFLLLLRQPHRFDASRGQLQSFLLGVARNLARKWLRGQRRGDVLDDEEFIVEPMNIESQGIAEVVGAAVQTLPPLQREVLILPQYEDFCLDEIADLSKSKSALNDDELEHPLVLSPQKRPRSLKEKLVGLCAAPGERHHPYGNLRARTGKNTSRGAPPMAIALRDDAQEETSANRLDCVVVSCAYTLDARKSASSLLIHSKGARAEKFDRALA